MLESLIEGMSMVFTLDNMLWSLFGVAFGVLMGAIPGLSDTIAIVLLLPFTFYLGAIPGIAMLMGLSKGGNFGGSIPAVLLNIPGTPQALITTFDGYPLTQQGKGGKALHMALYASVLADMSSDLILIFLAAPVAMMALKVGPPEYTMILFFSLVLIALAAGEDPVRGLISTSLGLLIGCVGLDPEFGSPRLMFDQIDLAEGVPLMPMVIGLMALSEVFLQVEKNLRTRTAHSNTGLINTGNPADQRLSWPEFRRTLPTIFRSTFIGSCVGIIPGIGTTVGSYLSYIAAKRASKHPETFGKGELEGIAASEAGNNAVNGPNLIPLVALGIPGNLAAALILGGFMIKGLTPGPMFMETQGSLLYALFTVLLLSNIYTLLIGKFCIRYARYVASIAQSTLYAGIMIFCAVGSFISNGQFFNLWVMFVCGLLGYLFTRLRLNLPVLIVAYFLGPLLEHKLRQTLLLADNNLTVFVTRPISCVFLGMTLLVILWYAVQHRHAHATAQQNNS